MSAPKTKPAKVFCSYSHADDKFRLELEKHLALLSQQDAIHVWHDRQIKPGTDWKKEINQNLEEADIVLLLVSADFMGSEYCTGVEMKRALERQDSGAGARGPHPYPEVRPGRRTVRKTFNGCQPVRSR